MQPQNVTHYDTGNARLSNTSDGALTTLTTKELHQALQQRGVEIAYSSLSQLLTTGDVAEQLGVAGGRNARRIQPAVIGLLAAFLPLYRVSKGTLPQAPSMLRSFLARNDAGAVPSPSGALALVETAGALSSVPVPEFVGSPIIPNLPNPPSLAEIARIQGRAQGLAMTERVLTPGEAAAFLRISVRLLRKSVPPFRRFGSSPAGDRWRLSDLVEVS